MFRVPGYFYSHIPRGMWHAYWLGPVGRRISTHTSLAGCDQYLVIHSTELQTFLLTHPSRDVTIFGWARRACEEFLLTHPSRDVTDKMQNIFRIIDHFYSHIPRGMWRLHNWKGIWKCRFLLTHPSRDVTSYCAIKSTSNKISTHTSLAGCDNTTFHHSPSLSDFYSHIPRGMWPFSAILLLIDLLFLLTHPSRDVTGKMYGFFALTNISTHTSLAGCDKDHSLHTAIAVHFYSHIPRGMWRILWGQWGTF